MDPHTEFFLGKDRENASSPLIAPSRKIGLISAKVKTNETYSLFGKKKNQTAGTHLQFTSLTIKWTPLCPVTAGGQLNLVIHHNSSTVPILNIWSPTSTKWQQEVHGNLGFLTVNNCPYLVEGRLVGFSGTEAGIISITLHMDFKLRTQDLSPCKLIPSLIDNLHGPSFLYTSYTEDSVPDTNIHHLKHCIEDLQASVHALCGGRVHITESQALSLIATFRVRIVELLEHQEGTAFLNYNLATIKNMLTVATTSVVSKSYRTCLSNILDKMVVYDEAYWKKVLASPEK
ncbi:gene 3 protein [Taro vein chlorosis virus]|uniref:Movement protein n=1 Tax=Taro vein chlorosis virus TaxID=2749935 RepID=MVP_TAVCV|nr:gene 3 protein [Taro vein chlorosis virus]Q5GA88.1 RecName: Full=Movement protein; Short=MP; AltName: Full=Cell-to-cell transport protein; AltName: Full=Protein 3 [Alphanucleorhabdovirus colocasiae]AAV92084.1 gene 3 protein [Taro vein chlorosis virus]